MLKPYFMIKSVLMPLLMVALTQPTMAEEKAFYDRINLTAETVSEVENDTLVAVLYAQREGAELAKLSNEVNQTVSKAIKHAKKVNNVEVQTLDYQTYPVYDKKHITSWRVKQSLQLKSRDFQTLSSLIGELQNDLALESMSYQVSPAEKGKAEEELIGKAIAAFQLRAQNITRHLGRKTYRLVSMNVNTGGTPYQPTRMRAFAEADRASVAAPVMEPGKQTVTVTVMGTIELDVK